MTTPPHRVVNIQYSYEYLLWFFIPISFSGKEKRGKRKKVGLGLGLKKKEKKNSSPGIKPQISALETCASYPPRPCPRVCTNYHFGILM